MTTSTATLTTFLLARLDEDEEAAKACAQAFPSPWEVSDRGWRVRIYAADVPDVGDHAEPGDMRSPCVIDVEPDRHHRELNEGGWLSDRVDHIARHDPARVLAEVEAKRRIVAEHPDYGGYGESCATCAESDVDLAPYPCPTLRALASVYRDHPGFREEWAY
jgi:hypothetical protein